MENQTRFDLNAAVENWRNELAAESNLTPDTRRELEAHLRDSIAELRQRGLNDEESFWLARRRVGQPQQLGEEFEKADPVNVWRERVFWIAAGSLLVTFWADFFGYIPLHNWIAVPASAYIYISLVYLPPIFIAVLLVRGRMKNLICAFAWCFQSRLRLVIWATAFMFISISQAFVSYGGRTHGHSSSANAMEIIWLQLFSSLIWPLALIGLIAWLLPTQKRKTPKRA